MAPTISICIPVFNGGATVERAITSVLAQDGVELECVVVDDGSTDDSVVRCRSFDDGRVSVHAATDHHGLAANWTRALRLASGEYAILLGQDDALLPGALARIIDTFTSDAEVGLVAWGGIIDEPDTPPRHLARGHLGRLDPDLLRWLAFSLTDTPPPSQTAYRRATLDEVGYYDSGFAYCPELDLQYRIGAAGWWGAFLAEPLVRRGNAPERLTGQLGSTPVPLLDHYRLLGCHVAEEPGRWRSQRSALRRTALRAAVRDVEHRRIRSALSFAINTARAERRLRRAVRDQTST